MSRSTRIRALLAASLFVVPVSALAQPPAAPAAPQRPAPVVVQYTGPKHISDAMLQTYKAELAAQTTDPKWKRDVTLPEDWTYDVPQGVTIKQVSFYVDGGTRLYGKVFYPKDFNPKTTRYGGVVVGHGINAISLGIEKFAAAFASRGFVAMAIDYQSYGYSDSGADEIQLMEPDTSTDASPVSAKRMVVKVKRTNLDNVREVEDFRAAISYLQGEPGVDPNRIGTWATSNGGSVNLALMGTDARVKAGVVQVMGAAPTQHRAVPLTGNQLNDAIVRVKTGQGAEGTAGFSFPTKVDAFYTYRNRDVNAGAMLDRIRPTTAVLFEPSEKDELTGGNGSAVRGANFLNEKGVPSQVISFPGFTHFQAYSGTGFLVGSTLAGDWLLKYLGPPAPAPAGTKK